jgi:ABC-type Fe3+/spermidine/putrescine transport system ATPase subunit
VDIYNRPATAFVAGFIGTANLIPAVVVRTDERDCTVDAPGCGTFVVARSGVAWQAGSQVSVVVRPEHVQIASVPVDGHHRVHAIVRELTFQGPSVRCQLETAAGTPLVAHLPPSANGSGPRLGEELPVSWPAAAAHLVAYDALPSAEVST